MVFPKLSVALSQQSLDFIQFYQLSSWDLL
uniref:Uncharacterized protein n=1 Tax=Anguilla anguilla TaxID=7936 RepID=A0A0E9TJC6_ANGAN